jgi:type VI secretion system protein ImpH
MAGAGRGTGAAVRRPLSAIKLLLTEPYRFRFDAALRILMRTRRTGDPAAAAEFRTQPGRFYPAGEVTSVVRTTETRKPRMTVAMIGLIGSGGALPRLYETLAGASVRRGSSALHDFIDLLSNRMVSFFGQAGIKYRLHRSAEVASLGTAPDPVSRAVLALTGYGTDGLIERLEAGTDPLLHYAGLLAMRPRSAERLSALISDWLGRPVEVRQFAGAWLSLPPEQRTSLPRLGSTGSWNTLGGGAAIGVRSWDPHARIVLSIGPLDRAAFEAVLPDQPGYRRLVSLVQAFLGPETGFAINPVLAGAARFPLRLDRAGPFRLGWNTWISQAGGPRQSDAPDALFEVA